MSKVIALLQAVSLRAMSKGRTFGLKMQWDYNLFYLYCKKKSLVGLQLFLHMCLVGPPNPYKLQQSYELTFLIGLTLLNTKLAKKIFFTDVL